jgi:tetratricopeptide (TPR) repeat protein
MPPGIKDNASLWQAVELKGSGDLPSAPAQTQRGRRNKLKILIRSSGPAIPEIESTLKAVLGDAQQPEMYLDQGKNTQINFYDPFLMETLSDAYYTLSKLTNLRIKDEEKRFPELASKFNTDLSIAESCARLGQWKEASSFLGKADNVEGQLLKAQVLAHTNKVGEAKGILESLANSSKSPSDRRDIADCYYLLGFDLDKGLKLAGQAVKDKNSPNYYRTFANLLFATGQIESAMQQYAKGYKIEYRNRIDQIDPEYMTDYSFAIFKTNKLRYEEIVETLYHLQKEFPACRQMHYCMQGISAGLARSFETQRIFRKGG